MQAVTRDMILQAAQALSGVCDGAAAQDGMGYNGMDSVVAKSILRSPFKTDRQVRALWNILRKYHKQLSGMGFDYEALVPPEPTPKGEDDRNAYRNAGLPTPPPKPEGVRMSMVQVAGVRRIALQFEYKADLVAKVKALRTRGFDKDGSKCGLKNAWLLEDSLQALSGALKAFEGEKVEMAPEVTALLEKADQEYAKSRIAESDFQVPTKLPPYPFQRAGIQMIDEKNGRALLADEMGLGKTIQALGWMALRRDIALPAVVLCPATLRVNWVREAATFTDLKCLVIAGKSSIKAFKRAGVDVSEVPLPGYDLTILNYDLLSTETSKTWMKMLLRGEQVDYATGELIKCGRQAIKALEKGMASNKEIEIRNRLWKVLQAITALGDRARKEKGPKHIRASVAGQSIGQFMEMGWKTLISDESHYLIDSESQRGAAAFILSQEMKHVINMTGTPIVNRPKELWNQVRMVDPKIFPKFFDFGLKFCSGYETRFGWDFSGSSNLEELDRTLRSTVLIRRTIDQVLTELPEKTRVTIPLLIDDKLGKDYDKDSEEPLERMLRLKKERDEWKKTLSALSIPEQRKYLASHASAAARQSTIRGTLIEDMEKVKQAALDVKFPAAMEFVLSTQRQKGKLLVFTTHHATTDRVKEALKAEGVKVDVIDGRVDMAKRDPIKTAFQEGDTEVLVCGIRAASEGLTLTAASTVIFLEFDWNPAKHDQAEARVYRISQKNAVTVYYLIALGTIEQALVAMIDAKREVVAAALGEGDSTLEQDNILDAILDNLEKMVA